MLRGNANIECTTTAGDDDSNDDNVSLECADSGLGLPSDHDADRVAVPTHVAASTVCSRPTTSADLRHGLAADSQRVY